MKKIIKISKIGFGVTKIIFVFLFIIISFLFTQNVNAGVTTIYECKAILSDPSLDVVNSQLENTQSLEPDSAYYYYYLNLAIEKSQKH